MAGSPALSHVFCVRTAYPTPFTAHVLGTALDRKALIYVFSQNLLLPGASTESKISTALAFTELTDANFRKL